MSCETGEEGRGTAGSRQLAAGRDWRSEVGSQRTGITCGSVPSGAVIYGDLDPPLAPPLRSALAKEDVTRLYQHQAEGLSRFRNGENVVVATPTASGKSLIYNLALVELLSKEKNGHGLYLFPLKALAQDQYQAFVSFNQEL
ncbi:MAG: DEAD/DEAH box helicase, partial [Syntrophobacterales bacterium]